MRICWSTSESSGTHQAQSTRKDYGSPCRWGCLVEGMQAGAEWTLRGGPAACSSRVRVQVEVLIDEFNQLSLPMDKDLPLELP